MIKSMTGYGRGEYFDETTSLTIEVKAVNHRFSEVVIRGLQNTLSEIEQKVRAEIKKRFARGRFEVFVSLKLDELANREIIVNKKMVKKYVMAFNELKGEVSSDKEIDLNRLLTLNDVLEVQEKKINQEKIWGKLESVLNEALSNLEKMRIKDGQITGKDIKKTIKTLKILISKIEKRYPKMIQDYKDGLEKLVRDYLGDKIIVIEESKFYQELINYTDRMNINEELVRLNGHISQVEDIVLKGDQPVGRKLDFLIQEMNREINTVGSKVSDISITSCVVEIKSEIEKIREHVQNVE
ncbi:MAG: YicC/YloC family endoribonuclease [bacterium]